MKTLMTTMLLAGTALMAQTTTAPAPAAGTSSAPGNTAAPAKVKKHQHKAKTSKPDSATTSTAPATK